MWQGRFHDNDDDFDDDDGEDYDDDENDDVFADNKNWKKNNKDKKNTFRISVC